jgi:hypothetical protein
LDILESKVDAMPKDIVKQLLSAKKADSCKQTQAIKTNVLADITKPTEVPKTVPKTKGKPLLLPAMNPM